MFGFRSDGKKVKNILPTIRILPNIMLDRADSQVYFKENIALNGMENYISKKMAEGIKLSYMNIIYAAIVRIIYERPELNRFAMNGSLYNRNKIFVSMVIKKNFADNGNDTVIKLPFNGTENIFEIKDKLDTAIKINKEQSAENNMDKLVKLLNLIPDFLIRWVVKFLYFADKHGFMPKKIIELSPFHTSVFLTNVGSLGIDSIYHHIYNFGTTSMFFAMGRKKKSYIYNEEEIREEKCITLAFVGDERICDGYYFATSFKQLCKYLKNPELLESIATCNVTDKSKEKITK